MNEYLITQLGQEHRNTLLAEAEERRLARLAQNGRSTWWQRLTGRTAAPDTDPRRQADPQAPRQDQHHLAA